MAEDQISDRRTATVTTEATKDERTYLACVAALGCYACAVIGGERRAAKARPVAHGRGLQFLAIPLCDRHSDLKAMRANGYSEMDALAHTIRSLYARRFSNFQVETKG